MTLEEYINAILDDNIRPKDIYINIHYGFNTINFMKERLINKRGLNRRTLIIYHGDRQYNDITREFDGDICDLSKYIKPNEGLIPEGNIVIADLYCDILMYKDGEFSIRKEVDDRLQEIDFSEVIIMNANYTFHNLIPLIGLIFSRIPLFIIGDSEGQFTDIEMFKRINNTSISINTVNKMPGFNPDILYFIKKLRTGQYTRLERVRLAEMEVELVNNENDFLNIEEVMRYDTVIDISGRTREYNNHLRDDVGFGFLPNVNEPIIILSPYIVSNDRGDKITVDVSTIFKVVRVITDNGILRLEVEHRGERITFPVNTSKLERYSEHPIPKDLERYNQGVEIEYAYFIKPVDAINKVFNNVLIYLDNMDTKYMRLALYTVLQSVRRSFKIKTQMEYYLS